MLKALALVLLLQGAGQAAGLKSTEVQPTHLDEGRNPVFFSVQCSSQAWTVVQSSDTISRSITMYAPRTNPNGASDAVCISSVTTTSQACNDGVGGVELTPDSAFTDYTKVQWNCRSRANNTQLGTVKGYRGRDKGDYGYIGAPDLQ